MLLFSSKEAFFVACEMERSAVQMYTRALALTDTLPARDSALEEMLRSTLAQETEHLRLFSALYEKDEGILAPDRQLLLTGEANNLLCEGGLMGAVRKGLLKDRDAMLRFAEKAEALSANQYREFAALAVHEEARNALMQIAGEEDTHRHWLEAQISG